MSVSREAYRYQRNSCCFSTGGFAKLNRLKGQTEEQQQQQEQGQEEEQERAAALSFVPCHVGNFHGQRWAFGPDLTTALRNANAQSVAQMRRCAENSVSISTRSVYQDDKQKEMLQKETISAGSRSARRRRSRR